MNRNFVLQNLREARDELARITKEIESRDDYDNVEYEIDMRHLYHHLNTAWNTKDFSDERIERCNDKDFRNWRQFPKDMDMSV